MPQRRMDMPRSSVAGPAEVRSVVSAAGLDAVPSVCAHCSLGCGLYWRIRGSRITAVIPRTSPASPGRLCLRGWHAFEPLVSPQRVRQPMVRREGRLQPAGWEEALEAVVAGVRAARKSGGAESVGFLGSARASNEDNFALGRFARTCAGTNNVDFSARLGMPEGLSSGWWATGGAGADPSRYDVVLVCEGDLATDVPVLAGHLIEAARAGLSLVVIGTRKTQLAELATTFLQVRPGGEASVLIAILRLLSEGSRDWVEATSAMDDQTRAALQGLSVTEAASRAGLTPEAVTSVAEMVGAAERVLLLHSHSLGLSASGEQAVSALATLARWSGLVRGRKLDLACGSTYPNIVGARLAGIVPGSLKDGDALTVQRSALTAVWQAALPEGGGLAYPEMLDKVKCLFVMQDDPLRHASDPARVRSALEQMDLVVVQDYLRTDLMDCAHVVLPCPGPGEYAGTMVNMFGLVQALAGAAQPPHEAMAGWQVFGRLAQVLGEGWRWDSAQQVFAEMARVVPACSGATFEQAAEATTRLQPSQADVTAAPPGLPRPTEPTDPEYPLIVAVDPSLEFLASDPVAASSATLKREAITPILKRVAGMALLHPRLMESLRLRRGTLVRLVTREGSAEVPVAASDEVQEGVVLLPHSLGARHGGALGMHAPGLGKGLRFVPRAARAETKSS